MKKTSLPENNLRIGCILMASGLSERYGRNKLLEKLDGREIILHTAGNLKEAGFRPLAVTRNGEILRLMEREGIDCVLHDGPKKSDTIHAGLSHLEPEAAGYLFMPGDQPLVRMAEQGKEALDLRPVKIGLAGQAYGAEQMSLIHSLPTEEVTIPLYSLVGEELKAERIPCDLTEAAFAWELWDADTPENMEKIREAYFSRTKA